MSRIVPLELDGALVSGDFPLFNIDNEVILPEFLSLLLRSDKFVDACKRSSRGTTNRKRLKEELFLGEEVLVPTINVQEKVIQLLELVNSVSADIQQAANRAENSMNAIANYVFV